MAESSWSIPFFPPKKRLIAGFLRTVNVGTSTNPTSLVLLGRRKPSGGTSTDDAFPDDSMPSWACPAVSPRSAGLACPMSLYGEKTVPPRRSERDKTPITRRRRHVPGSGPNRRRSLRQQRRRTPPSAAAVHDLFKRPKRLRRLIEWTLQSHYFVPAEDDHDELI